ncbi:TRAP transporter substrate-binding protein DctP [Thermodesulfobacteriota bacterium]
MGTSKRFMVLVFGLFFGLSLITVGLSQRVSAADTIKIRCGWTFPQQHPMGASHQIWADKIEKDSGGRVKMEHYWSGSLVNMRESYTELLKGVADISEFTGHYVREGFQIEKAMSLLFYGVPTNSEVAYRIYGMLCDKYPQILEEFAAAKVMAFFSPPAVDLMTRNKPVRKIENIRGLTLKTSGDMAKVINSLGGEGASMPISQTYMAMQKGTIDGALVGYEGLKSFRFAEVVKYYTILNSATWPSGHVAMNLDSYNKLPPDIRKIFDDNIDFYGKTMAEQWDNANKAGEEFAKKQGVEFIELQKEELQKFYKAVKSIVLNEAKRLDDMGIPGTKMVNDARGLIDQYVK